MKKIFTLIGGLVVGLVAAGIVLRYTGNGWIALVAAVGAVIIAAK